MALSWPWRFISLSPPEIEHRREVLDLRGYYAQVSVLLAIIAIRVYRMNSRASSPQNTENKQRSWWDSPLFQKGTETRKQYLVSFIWLGWLLSLSVWNTGDGRWTAPLLSQPVSFIGLSISQEYGLEVMKCPLHAVSNGLANHFRLSPFHQGSGPRRSLPAPFSGPNVASRIHIHLAADTSIISINPDIRPSVSTNALPSSFRSDDTRSASPGPCYSVSFVFCAVQPSRLSVFACKAVRGSGCPVGAWCLDCSDLCPSLHPSIWAEA